MVTKPSKVYELLEKLGDAALAAGMPANLTSRIWTYQDYADYYWLVCPSPDCSTLQARRLRRVNDVWMFGSLPSYIEQWPLTFRPVELPDGIFDDIVSFLEDLHAWLTGRLSNHLALER